MLTFKVRGGEGDIYTIAAERIGNDVAMSCSCQAGANGLHCRHRIALLVGDVSDLVSGSVEDVKRLATMVDGTDVGDALPKYIALEAAKQEAETRLKAIKRKLADALNKGPASVETRRIAGETVTIDHVRRAEKRALKPDKD